MQRTGFVSCCSAQILHGLSAITATELKAELSTTPGPLVVAITSFKQVAAETELQKAGFRNVFKAHSSHGNGEFIRLWVRDLEGEMKQDLIKAPPKTATKKITRRKLW